MLKITVLLAFLVTMFSVSLTTFAGHCGGSHGDDMAQGDTSQDAKANNDTVEGETEVEDSSDPEEVNEQAS